MLTLLSHYDFYLTCSRFEGCPKSVLEAMSCGLCVLAYDSPGINDISSIKAMAYTRPNPSIVSQQIREFINDKPLIDRIKKNATQTIIEDFSAKSVFHKYELEFND